VDTNNHRIRELVDFAAPAFTTAPPAVDAERSGTIAFASVTGATFRCSLAAAGTADNDRVWQDCAGAYAYSDLADGDYELRVRAFTAAGAASRTASHTWTVDVPDAPADRRDPDTPATPANPSAPSRRPRPRRSTPPRTHRSGRRRSRSPSRSRGRMLRSALARRIHVVRCTRDCELIGTMTVSSRVARKLHLRSRTVGTVRGHDRGKVLLPVRVNATAARALRRHPRTVLVTVTVSDQRGHKVVQTVRLLLKSPTR
jgi:hypothetical protein